jgi:uncharacterized protein (TIGR02001 family)
MSTKRIEITCGVAALMAASLGSMSLAVADSPYSISANIGVVSNYMWRGVTQTLDGAAVQGGLDFTHESGFYAGTWASNIDWNDEGSSQEVIIPLDPATGEPATDNDGNLIGVTSGSSNNDSPNYELDIYLGYGGSVNDDFSYDLSAIYYAYPDGRDSNFAELGASATYKWFTLGLAYTVYGANDDGLFDNGDFYYYGSFEYGDLPFGLAFSARGGYYDFNNNEVVVGALVDTSTGAIYDETESANYWHYGASINKDAGDFGTFSLNWDQNNGNTDVGYDNDPKFWVGWLKEF